MTTTQNPPAAPSRIPVMKPALGPDEAQAAADAVASGWVAQGPRVASFEEAFAARVGAPEAVATSSCTTALHLSLVLAGIERGDDVIVPSLSFIATANVARYVGANPVFADVELPTQGLTRATVEAALTPKTKAVILVHQCGTPADIQGVHDLCDPLGIAVIEDAACAVGATYRGAPIGNHSELVAFSFHPRKVITTGEGGMLTTANAEWATRARRLREHGMSLSAAERHAGGGSTIEQYLEVGFNYRMSDIQAAVGLVQLARLDEIVGRRRDLAHRYQALLADVPGLTMIGDPSDATTNFQSFWVLFPEEAPVSRDDVLLAMNEAGISPRRGIMAAHLEPAYADAALSVPLPNTERVTRDSLILPLFHVMTSEEQDRVADVLVTLLG
jgi:perosamine synthetase